MRRVNIACALALGLAAHTLAFDTGPHFDATEESLREAGFGTYPIQMVQLENWLTDFYSNDPSFGSKDEVDLLHFDNLPNLHAVQVYWGHFTNNAKRAFTLYANANDPFAALAALGMTLHAVQDFYTHSNWVELHPFAGGQYRSITYLDEPFAANVNLYTGKYPTDGNINASNELLYHGNYGFGLNHDSYSRPKWDEAYVFAYVASRQWLQMVKLWVESQRPGFWNSMRNYYDAGSATDLDTDQMYQYRISEWTFKPGNGGTYSGYADGKWKGEYSGKAKNFLTSSLAFVTYRSRFSMEFTTNFRFRDLIPNLSQATKDASNMLPPAIDGIQKLKVNKRVIFLRTTTVDDFNGFFDATVDPVGSYIDWDRSADFYGYITVNPGTASSKISTEAVRSSTATGAVNWRTVAFVNPNQRFVGVRYQLWDEDTASLPPPYVPPGLPGFVTDDDHCDINAAVGKLDLNFTFSPTSHQCTGDVLGRFDSPNATFATTGTESKRAKLVFYITEYPIKEEAVP